MTESNIDCATEANRPARLSGEGFGADVYFSPLNQRIQVLSYEGPQLTELVERLRDEATTAGFGKVFMKAPAADREILEKAGMQTEGSITGYFNGHDAAVMGLFLNSDRSFRDCLEEEEAILEKIRSRPADSSVPELPEGYTMKPVELSDADEIAGLYATVFASYPFPITEAEYIRSTMQDNVAYRIVRDGSGQVVAAASAETDPDHRNAEMTDFATLPSQRGLGLAQHLLAALEEDMAGRSIPNLYTIARARSAGMNRVFYNRGYTFTGTLVNNCHIAGRFEDMHIWCKTLR